MGSTRLVSDASGAVVARHDYLPFGEELPTLFGNRSSVAGYSNTDDTRQKFTGKERDSESGFDNFEARYNSSPMGRFLSPDPGSDSGFENQDDPQSWNGYSYVRNNSLNLVDPDGRDYHVCVDNDNGKGGKNCFDVATEDQLKNLVKSSGATIQDGQILVNINGQNVVTGTYQFFVGPGLEGGGMQPSPSGDALIGGLVAGFAGAVRGIFEFIEGLVETGGSDAVVEIGVPTTRSALSAGEENTINHIFGKAQHNLADLVAKMGSKEAAMDALRQATTKQVLSKGINGLFIETVTVAGENVTVKGIVQNGVVEIGTAYKP